MKRYWYLLVIILNLLMIIIPLRVVHAGEEGVKLYTLEQSIKDAFENNWLIKAGEEKVSESEFAKNEAKAGFLPTFSTSYSYTHLGFVPSIDTSVFGNNLEFKLGDQDIYQWQATIRQPIFTGYALTSTYELTKLGIDQSRVALELEKLDLALKVKEAYYNILKTDKAVDVANSAVESLKSHLEVAKNFYDVGMIPVNDLLKAEVELANTQHNLIQAQNASRIMRVSFNVLLSRSVDEPFEIEDILKYTKEIPDFDNCLQKALKARPEIKALDLTDAQIDQQINLAKSKYYPEVAFTYNYTKAGDTPNVSGSNFQLPNQWQANVGLSWTFWDWYKTKNSVNQTESQKRQLSQTRNSIEDGIKLQLKQAILNINEAEEKIPTAQKAVDQAEENLRVSEERYKAQVTTSTEVLDAQTLLSQARMNYYNALYDHNLARAGLLRAIGEY
ncbi:MAG TPA: TolC family protein [Desulfatiglandales bacterium]|nr:TolC family protein [Desulfatiglandales bacterium]